MSETRGFQLVEMLAVLAIVGLLTSFAVAPLLRLSAATRVRSAAEEMVGVLRQVLDEAWDRVNTRVEA